MDWPDYNGHSIIDEMFRFRLRVTKPQRKYALLAESRRVDAAWSSVTSLTRRHHSVMTEEQRSWESELTWQVQSFTGDVRQCGRAILPCSVHRKRSNRQCIKQVRSEADRIVARIRRLQEGIEASAQAGSRQGD